MASALGRLEKYRGNATLHGFLYSIDPCIQSFKIVYQQNRGKCMMLFLKFWFKALSCEVKELWVQAQNQT